jgi:hypothetical protein
MAENRAANMAPAMQYSTHGARNSLERMSVTVALWAAGREKKRSALLNHEELLRRWREEPLSVRRRGVLNECFARGPMTLRVGAGRWAWCPTRDLPPVSPVPAVLDDLTRTCLGPMAYTLLSDPRVGCKLDRTPGGRYPQLRAIPVSMR